MTDLADTGTEDVGTETFTFDAGPWAWRDFVHDVVEIADDLGLAIEFERRKGFLWFLLGVTLAFTVTGPVSVVTQFGELAEQRANIWRQSEAGGPA